MTKLTKRTVDALSPRQKQYVEYDANLTGFGVAVYPSGIKSWICEYRPHGGGRGVAKKRVTLGKVTQLTPEQARRPRQTCWPPSGSVETPHWRKPSVGLR